MAHGQRFNLDPSVVEACGCVLLEGSVVLRHGYLAMHPRSICCWTSPVLCIGNVAILRMSKHSVFIRFLVLCGGLRFDGVKEVCNWFLHLLHDAINFSLGGELLMP